MLVDVEINDDPILTMIAAINNNSTETIRLDRGIYERGHFGGTDSVPGFDEYPEFSGRDAYGVCDEYQQVLAAYPELRDSDREFVLMLTPIEKAKQAPEGGWRWHKWGQYIGTQTPQCEYLYDEPEVEKVYVFHLYERAR